MGESTRSSRRLIRSRAAHAGACAVLVATVLAGCSSTNTSGAGSSGSGEPAIPSSAFSDHTGVTSSSVTIANVSTLAAGLFKGVVSLLLIFGANKLAHSFGEDGLYRSQR